jgi:hypothetical protein
VAPLGTQPAPFGPFWPRYTGHIHARCVTQTPFQTVSIRSTLAVWSRITSHRLGTLERPSDFLRVARTDRPAKSPPAKEVQLLEGSFSLKGSKGPQALVNMVASARNLDQRLCGIRQRGISIPFAQKWLKSSNTKFAEYPFHALR